MNIEEIVRGTLSKYSYFASDLCIAEIASEIKKSYAEIEEKAWMYDEVTK